MMDIVGLGSTFVDIFFHADKTLFNKFHLQQESSFSIKDVQLSMSDIKKQFEMVGQNPGGMSFNTVLILSSLGLKTGYDGIIGNDAYGKKWLSFTKKKGVITKTVTKGRTSLCACLVSHDGEERTFISDINPYEKHFFNHINEDFLNDAKLIHISPFFLSSQKESITLIYKLLDRISGPKISFTPSIFYSVLDINLLIPIFTKSYIVFFNEKELYTLTGKGPLEGSKEVLSYGPHIVVCTCGKNGAYVSSKNLNFTITAKSLTKIIDSTGAGDAFAAGFLYGLLHDKTLEWSAEFGTRLAAKSLMGFGLSWIDSLHQLD